MISAKQAVWLVELADRAAARLCRQDSASHLEREDVAQDLLADLLSRLHRFDAARSPFRAFVVLCIAHRSALVLRAAVRENAARHPVDLDAPLADRSTVRVVDTLDEGAGYSAWVGQPSDRLLELERRLDLDRAVGTLPASVVSLCADMLRPRIASDSTRASRSTLHRRRHDLRCRLLAAGVGGERG